MCHCTPPVFTLAALVILLVVGVVFGRRRYKWPYLCQPPHAGLQRTLERFVDPVTGETVTVWFDPATGERHYVDDAPAD